MTWNLRRVKHADGLIEVQEVHYDDEGIPWAWSEARLRDKIWFIRDWLRTPVLDHRKDFTGEAPKATGIRPLEIEE